MEPPWLSIALDEMRDGVVEVPGPGDEPRVVEYHSATSLAAQDDEVPWCSSFVNWCMWEGGIGATRSARARSWLRWGVAVDPPPYGAVVVLQRGGGNQPGRNVVEAPGHVGFYVGHAGPEEVLILGGNQGDAVCIKGYPADRVLDYRWPTR